MSVWSSMFMRRRPAVMLAVSVAVLGLVVGARLSTNQSLMMTSDPAVIPPSAPVELGSEDAIARLQDRLRQYPDDANAYAELGLAFLQRFRDVADASLYGKAETALDEALARDPRQLDALIGQGMLALSRHQFADAIEWAEGALAINPYRAQIYGIIGDAQIELGRYDEAVATLQKMVDTRPDINSYSRVSYARELYGDVPGAIDAMKRAIAAGNPASESVAWSTTQLGHLYFNSGDLDQAEQAYRQALVVKPDYVYGLAGLARVSGARGQTQAAIAQYGRVVERLPLPEFVIALGEVYESAGQNNKAKQQYDLVRAIQQLMAQAGADVDLELALFNADHGSDPAKALEMARAAYTRRPSILGADALAWALYQAGQFTEAQRYAQQALRLGTRDAMLHFHAGMIAHALGQEADARQHFELALEINPRFSVRYAPVARNLLGR